jgi:hypothetical protein
VARIAAALVRSAILTLLAPTAFGQQTAPSDNDLRSAYCMAVLKGQIPWVRDQVVAKVDGAPPAASSPELQQANAKARTDAHVRLERLLAAQARMAAYLSPRLNTLDSAALLLAMDRGEADWREFQAHAKGARIDEGLRKRIKACADHNWLPF